jgi:hypothetical protein
METAMMEISALFVMIVLQVTIISLLMMINGHLKAIRYRRRSGLDG